MNRFHRYHFLFETTFQTIRHNTQYQTLGKTIINAYHISLQNKLIKQMCIFACYIHLLSSLPASFKQCLVTCNELEDCVAHGSVGHDHYICLADNNAGLGEGSGGNGQFPAALIPDSVKGQIHIWKDYLEIFSGINFSIFIALYNIE